MGKQAAETCKVCGAPRARTTSGEFYKQPFCETHRLEAQRSYSAAHYARKKVAKTAGQIAEPVADLPAGQLPGHLLQMLLSIDIAISAGETVSTISGMIFQEYNVSPVAAAPRRQRARRLPLRLHKPLRNLIVATDYPCNQIVYVRGRIVRSAAMPQTYGELKKQLLEHHQDDGYLIAQ